MPKRLGRRKILRNIEKDHSHVCFKPCGVRGRGLEKIVLECDEMEAIRLANYENLYQQECADRMGISRTTFSRLVSSANKKIAEALLHGKALEITIS
ncbi:MAG TPA: DUF134 domain-containing protein [Campylobacterales bacterium]|nr:DUF134 domain-containing protein [Campylobacterales bacterium]HHC11419.1 DUF134 domain-containing protein [Campylobacterales bacterium]